MCVLIVAEVCVAINPLLCVERRAVTDAFLGPTIALNKKIHSPHADDDLREPSAESIYQTIYRAAYMQFISHYTNLHMHTEIHSRFLAIM